MSEKDILHRQELNGQKEFFLILVGQFYHAYGCGAFALSRASGYRVLRKKRKWGELLMAGFPVKCIDKVKQHICDNHGSVRAIDEGTYLFAGIDGTPDETLVVDTMVSTVEEPQPTALATGLLEELNGFNLAAATPLDAMNFVARLQAMARKEAIDGTK